MNDPIALISTETPIIKTKHFTVYEINDYIHDRTYSVFDNELGNTVFYGTMQECSDYVVGYYAVCQMR